MANWVARRFKRFKNRKAGDRGKYVDASAPIRYVVESINEEEKGFRCRHVSAAFLPLLFIQCKSAANIPGQTIEQWPQKRWMSSDDEDERLSHERRVKKKMQDVFNYYGKPEINVKDGTKPKARRAKKRFDDNNNNNNNNTTTTQLSSTLVS